MLVLHLLADEFNHEIITIVLDFVLNNEIITVSVLHVATWKFVLYPILLTDLAHHELALYY